jgi:hypothetical protein
MAKPFFSGIPMSSSTTSGNKRLGGLKRLSPALERANLHALAAQQNAERLHRLAVVVNDADAQ